jgi:hypothetical protein
MDVYDFMLRSPSESLRKLAQEKDIGLATAHKAAREKLNFFPYKVTAVQELKTADHEKRIRYCKWFKNLIQTKAVDILDVTFFTDEAWFHLSGYVDTQNAQLWSSENPYAVHEKPLHDHKLGAWVAISRWRIVGPLFFKETVNRKRHCSMLHDFFGPLRKTKSPTPVFNKIALLRIQLTTL